MNTILRRGLLLLTFVFCISIVKAQIEYKPGYVITNAGDSLRGELAYRVQKLSHKSAIFIGEDGVKKEMRPESIQAYGYDNGQRFQSGIVDEVFVLVLIDSYLSLFEYDGVFYLKKDDELVKISSKEEVQEDGKTLTGAPLKIANTRKLNAMTAGCMMEEKLSFTSSGLSKVVISYNHCQNKMINYDWHEGQLLKIHISVLGSYVINSLNLKDNSENLYGATPFGGGEFKFSTSSFEVSFPMVLTSPQGGKQMFNIYTEPSFHTYSYSDEYLFLRDNTVLYEWQRNVEASIISIPIGLLFSFEYDKSQIDLLGGLSFGLVMQSTAKGVHTRTIVSSNQQTFQREYDYNVDGIENSVFLGLGYKRVIGNRQVGLNLRLRNILPTKVNDYEASYTGYRFGIGLSVNLIN